jgi:anaerobic ribonucleoside-triphosphate reductase activating protein
MNIAHIEPQSYIYGPGCRFVIWTQGCSIRCKGCWNHAMWDFAPKLEMTARQLFNNISQCQDTIEGVTLLGGEPLDQYDETLALLRLCSDSGLSAMLFTGYEMFTIKEKGMGELFKYVDILITGPYEEKNRTLQHQWIGSTNQQIHFISDRYKNYKMRNTNYMELTIAEDGSITVMGFPDKNAFDIFD